MMKCLDTSGITDRRTSYICNHMSRYLQFDIDVQNCSFLIVDRVPCPIRHDLKIKKVPVSGAI